jgi:hypothetical protein
VLRRLLQTHPVGAAVGEKMISEPPPRRR